jgi:DNA polymerase-3 subunit gamma/tau
MAQPLANKYRPKKFEDVSEQGAIKTIIENQIKSNDIRNAYLFCGGAGTGKTTCARIVAGMINEGQGNPIELDAASNNSVDDVRRIITDSKFKSMDSKYKIYIIDECHSLSNAAWQAMLKLLEEPPKSTVFIFCTTDPQKIPGTILSRVQRYNFQRISKEGIIKRLKYIIDSENNENINKISYEDTAIEYIAKQAQGGMRDAITTLDKCLQYNNNLSLQNVVTVLSSGVTPYELFDFTLLLLNKDSKKALDMLNSFFMSGIDMSLLLNMYFEFLLNIQKYLVLGDKSISNLPEDILNRCSTTMTNTIRSYVQKLYNVINAPKMDIKVLMEAWVMERCI